MPAPEVWATSLLAVAVGLALGRWLWWQRLAGDARAPWVRMAVLAALTAASGLLLYLTLFPPRLPVGGETLVVATAGAPRDLKTGSGEALIALPEAPRLDGAERVPDLATALRRHVQAQRVWIVGLGLPPRDRDAPIGLPVAFRPPPIPRGLIRLEPPVRTAAGAVFTVAGEASGLTGGTAELLDPAGRRVDQRTLGLDGRFTLAGTARAAGTALFTLRLRDRTKVALPDIAVPLWTVPERPVRVLLVGAPAPETKYLRRWASDAGIALTSQLDAGGGVRLGDAPVGLDPATLRRFDALILDDHSWTGFGAGARGAIASAVAGGLGVVIRMTAPASAAARNGWRGLGIDVAGGEALTPLALPPLAPDQETLAARRGPASADADPALDTLDAPMPQLGRWDMRVGMNAVAAVTDEHGAPVAVWFARGQGRAALWAAADSYALVLGGQKDRYAQWWSDTVTAVARPQPDFVPVLPAVMRVGERAALCGIEGEPRVTGPDGRTTALAIDAPRGSQGCAGFWPAAAGFHALVQPARGGDRVAPFYVYPGGALPAAAALATSEATAQLAAASTSRNAPPLFAGGRGPAWPWFLGWLAVSALLWLVERRREWFRR